MARNRPRITATVAADVAAYLDSLPRGVKSRKIENAIRSTTHEERIAQAAKEEGMTSEEILLARNS